jgi:hypothetical protein
MIRLVTIFSLLPLFSGCDWFGPTYPETDHTPELVVHGLLLAGIEEQTILVEHTRSTTDGFYRDLTAAQGAEVLLISGSETHRGQEDPEEPGRYTIQTAPVAGERYRLEVRDADGCFARGETVIPGAPKLLTPSRDTVVRWGDPFDLVWTSAKGAAYVVVRAAPAEGVGSLLISMWVPTITLDTTFRTPVAFNEGSGRRFAVASVDENFVVYRSPREDLPVSPQLSTLEGGYGFFGSAALSEFRSVMVEPRN